MEHDSKMVMQRAHLSETRRGFPAREHRFQDGKAASSSREVPMKVRSTLAALTVCALALAFSAPSFAQCCNSCNSCGNVCNNCGAPSCNSYTYTAPCCQSCQTCPFLFELLLSELFDAFMPVRSDVRLRQLSGAEMWLWLRLWELRQLSEPSCGCGCGSCAVIRRRLWLWLRLWKLWL